MKIKNRKIFLVHLVLLILILQFGFVMSEGEEVDLSDNFGLDSGSIIGSGIEYSAGSVVFLGEDSYLEVNGNRFENIVPQQKGSNPSIEFDFKGNIVQADFEVNENGGTYVFEGKDLIVPPHARVQYSEFGGYVVDTNENGGTVVMDGNVFEFSKKGEVQYLDSTGFKLYDGGKIVKMDSSQEIYGENVNLFDEVLLERGSCKVSEEGYFIIEGRANYKGMKMEVNYFESSGVLIGKEGSDLSGFVGNSIQSNSEGLKIQASPEETVRIDFTDDNGFFDLSSEELNPNEERTFSMKVSRGDNVEILDKQNSEDNIVKIKHFSTESTGNTLITSGRHTFQLDEDSFFTERGNLNSKNKFSVPFSLSSNGLKNDILRMEENNGYYIYDENKKIKFTFDKSLLDSPIYDFKSTVGKDIYSFAEDQVGNSAFIWGGRGEVYYGGSESNQRQEVPVEGVKAYDCIGLAQCSLVDYYGGRYSDFPPNLKLEGALNKKGWTSKYIEPKSVNSNTRREVIDIPAGAIVFLMHPASPSSGLDGEGVNYNRYTNSQGEKLDLIIGHTLIRGKGDTNFINAVPGSTKLIPKKAREYDESLVSEGKPGLFSGSIKEGQMVPNNDYLLVMSPPETSP